MVKIRLARGGRTHRPVFTIVATDARNPRDGKFMEKLGQYDPMLESPFKDVRTEAINTWVSKGAELSGALKSLFKKHKVSLA